MDGGVSTCFTRSAASLKTSGRPIVGGEGGRATGGRGDGKWGYREGEGRDWCGDVADMLYKLGISKLISAECRHVEAKK